MRRWAIINKDTEKEIIDLGWFIDLITQRDMVGVALNDNERVAVVETDFDE